MREVGEKTRGRRVTGSEAKETKFKVVRGLRGWGEKDDRGKMKE